MYKTLVNIYEIRKKKKLWLTRCLGAFSSLPRVVSTGIDTEAPSDSRFERGRGRVVGGGEDEKPPPTRISSEGGMSWW
jgi:hypothetical protein